MDTQLENEPHEASRVKCNLCTYEWIAVRPLGLTELECPNCENITGFENVTNELTL
jgi:formate dehydrogenase maturation protein FdhE